MKYKPNSGDRGEAAVARYLRDKGYVLLTSQWRCRFGETDLVARDRHGTICFVEVKLRSNLSMGLPREYVDGYKQERLRKTAAAWLARFDMADRLVRFDVAEVYMNQKFEITKLEYLENAFT